MKKYKIGYFLVRRVSYSDSMYNCSWNEIEIFDYTVYPTLNEAETVAIGFNDKFIMIRECKIDDKGIVTPLGTLHKIKYNRIKKEEHVIPEKPEWKIVE